MQCFTSNGSTVSVGSLEMAKAFDKVRLSIMHFFSEVNEVKSLHVLLDC